MSTACAFTIYRDAARFNDRLQAISVQQPNDSSWLRATGYGYSLTTLCRDATGSLLLLECDPTWLSRGGEILVAECFLEPFAPFLS